MVGTEIHSLQLHHIVRQLLVALVFVDLPSLQYTPSFHEIIFILVDIEHIIME